MGAGKKRAQISVFLIVAVLILIIGGLFLVTTQKPRETKTLGEGIDTEPVKGNVNLCLKQKLIEGAQIYGFSKKANIEKHIESEVKGCIDSAGLKKQGLNANIGKPSASVEVSGTTYTAALSLPITVNKGSSKTRLTSFSTSVKRERQIALSNTPEGLKQPVSMVTGDGTFELSIEKGTMITGKEGDVQELKIKTNDKRHKGLDNSIVLGGISYDISPDGTALDKPAKITIYYNKETLPKGVSPATLAIAYYDQTKERWVGLQSSVDKEKGSVTATTLHFSGFAIVMNCAPSESNEPQTIYLGWVYREPCYTTGTRAAISCSPEWMRGDDGSIYAPADLEEEVKIDSRFMRALRDKERPSCFKADWDKNPETPDTYGYPALQDVGGTGRFAFRFTQESGNTCIHEKDPIRIKLDCDDECINVRFNGEKLKQENGEYIVPETIIKAAGQDNIIEADVHNTAGHCSGARGTLEFTGTGLLPECGDGEVKRNCRCGTGQNIRVAYDDEKLHEVMENNQKAYGQLEDSELEEAILEERKVYCCQGLLSDMPCEELQAAAKQEEVAEGGTEQKEPEQSPAQPEKKAFDCTVQERVNYLCRHGPKNEEAYNPEYPKCSGEVEGRRIGFSDNAMAAEMGYLSQQARDAKLIELPEYDETGEYYGKAFCTLEQATGKEAEQAAETEGQKPEEAAAVQAEKIELPEPGAVDADGFKQKAHLGNNLWQSCTKESLGLMTNINSEEGFDLLCRKNGDWYEFTECDTDNTKEHTGAHGGTAAQGTIYEIKGNDYMCVDSNGYERWAKCGGTAYTADKSIYVPDSSTINVNGKAYYCCTDTFRTAPCSTVSAKRTNLCLHTELNSDLVSEDKELELARSIGAEYIKQTFEWSAVQPSSPNEWNWDMFDRWHQKIKAKNLKVIARLSGAPKWVRTEKGINTGYKFNKEYKLEPCDFEICGGNNRPDMNKLNYYGEFVKKFVERYKPEYVQIWNEPNLQDEWSFAGTNPAEYAELLKAGYKATKEANSQTKVIIGALAPTDTHTFKEEACKELLKRGKKDECDTYSRQGYVSYDEYDFLSKLYESDQDIGNHYDLLGLNSHPFQETSPYNKCGEGQKLSNWFSGREVSWMLAPLKGPGGGCWAFDRIRLTREYLKTTLNDDKPIAILEFSQYLNQYYGDRRDMENPEIREDEEKRQAKKLEEGYKRAMTEWKDWAGPVCWFLTSSNPRWDAEGNIFRCDASKCDYSVRPTGCSYASVSDKPVVASLATDCGAGGVAVT